MANMPTSVPVDVTPVVGQENGHVNHSNIFYDEARETAKIVVGPTAVNVKNPDFAGGAVGDGVALDSAAFAAAELALPTGGGRIMCPPGTYKADIDIVTRPNVEIVGAGNTGINASIGGGATIILVPSGSVGITGGTGTSAAYRGVVLRNLHVKGESGALGGIWLKALSHFLLENVTVSDFLGASAYGIKVNKEAGFNTHYGTLVNARVSDTKVGLDVHSNGLRVVGGTFEGDPATTGDIGIVTRSGCDTVTLLGVNVQGWDQGVFFEGGTNHKSIGGRYEGNLVNLDISTTGCGSLFDSFHNGIIGGVGTGIRVNSGATGTTLLPLEFTSVATRISDPNGLATKLDLEDRWWSIGGPGSRISQEAMLVESRPAQSEGVVAYRPTSNALAGVAALLAALQNSASTPTLYARLFGIIVDNTAGSEDGKWRADALVNGTMQTFWETKEPTTDQAGVLLRVNRGGTLSLSQVTLGATDSGGAGFRVLRVPN